VGDTCRKVGISEGTYYAWKKQYAGLGISELRQLREANGRLKRRVAELSLDRQILQINRNKSSRNAAMSPDCTVSLLKGQTVAAI
jgi:putative transposase